MKRCIWFIAFALWAAGAAQAQQARETSGSTIQITAYWRTGDRMTYDYRATEYMVDNGDTVVMHTMSDIRTFEVIKATPQRYTVRITSSERRDSDPAMQMVFDLEHRKGLDVPLVIETSPHGELLCVVNAAEIVEAAHELVDAAEAIYDSLPDDIRSGCERWRWRDCLEKWINPPASTTQTIEDINRIFYFHGMRFEAGEEYEQTERLRVPASDAEAECVTCMWADAERTDAVSAMLHTYSEADAAKALADMAVVNPDAMILGGRISAEDLPKTTIKMEGFSGEEVHFATGWPLQAYWSTKLSASVAGGTQLFVGTEKQMTRRDEEAE